MGRNELDGKIILYHGSPIGGLTELKPFVSEHQKPYLYFAENSLVALLYAVKPVPKPFSFYPYGFGENGELLYSEYYENAFAELYEGKRGYLYECRADRKQLEEPTQIRGVYTCAEAVKVGSILEIPDLYVYYREREKPGVFRIRARREIPEKEMDFVREEMLGYMREYGLKKLPDHEMSGFIRTRFPEVWEKE